MPIFLYRNLIKIKQRQIQKKLSNKDAKVEISDPFIKIDIIKAKNATLEVNGTLRFEFLEGYGRNPVQIFLAPESTFRINGSFTIGQGVKISVQKGALLEIGGDKDTHSGITSDSRIMVLKRIIIGKDFGCSWDCLITDSDWHYIEHNGKPTSSQSDVVIGDRVWICPDCSVLKGTVISNDSIVGTKALLREKMYPQNSLIAGVPGKVVETGVKWKRDLP